MQREIRVHRELTVDEEAEVVEVDHSIQRVPEEVAPDEHRSNPDRTRALNTENSPASDSHGRAHPLIPPKQLVGLERLGAEAADGQRPDDEDVEERHDLDVPVRRAFVHCSVAVRV